MSGTEEDAIDRADPVEDLLGNYHIIKYGNEGKSETDWWELAQAIQSLLAEARKDELKELHRQLFSDDEEVVYEMIQDYLNERLDELAALGGKSDE